MPRPAQALPPPVTAATTRDPLTRAQRLQGPLVSGGVVGVLTVALHVRDPHVGGSWGFCPWVALTGLYCPGCGGLRAVNDLTNLDVVGAASSNLLFVALVPAIVVAWLRWVGRAWPDQAGDTPGATGPDSSGRAANRSNRRGAVARPLSGLAHPGLWIAVLAVAMVAFTVLRNLPAGSWLAP